MSYQSIIREIDPHVMAAGVEAHMRLEYGTLDHLPRERFAAEVRLAKECEAASPGYLKSIAESMGVRTEMH